LRREDSNLCISESEFAKTLSPGRQDSNLCISESDALNFDGAFIHVAGGGKGGFD
jgi:hypothetical protein